MNTTDTERLLANFTRLVQCLDLSLAISRSILTHPHVPHDYPALLADLDKVQAALNMMKTELQIP